MKIFLLQRVCQVKTCCDKIYFKFKDEIKMLLKKIFLKEKKLVEVELTLKQNMLQLKIS